MRSPESRLDEQEVQQPGSRIFQHFEHKQRRKSEKIRGKPRGSRLLRIKKKYFLKSSG